MDERVKQFADAIIPILSIPEIFPSINIDDFPKISKELEKILTYEEMHFGKGCGVCKTLPISISYVCGLDIIDVKYSDLLKIMGKENEMELFIQYVQMQLNNQTN